MKGDTMKVACAHEFNGPLLIEEMPAPKPKKGEVLVRVKACAITVGDINTILGKRKEYYGGEFKFPHVPGYQGAGIVEYAASNVKGWRNEERVVISGLISCGTCEYCQAGLDNLCPKHKLIGIDSGTQGCYAEYVSVPARNIFRLSENVPFEQAVMI
jgi:L-iditol 2-dehydrogenase